MPASGPYRLCDLKVEDASTESFQRVVINKSVILLSGISRSEQGYYLAVGICKPESLVLAVQRARRKWKNKERTVGKCEIIGTA